MMRKRMLLLGFGTVLLAGCGQAQAATTTEPPPIPTETTTISPLYPEYASLAELTDASSAVVVGKVVASRTALFGPLPFSDPDPMKDPQAGLPPGGEESPKLPGTISTIEVTQSLSGSVAVGDRIDVSQPGGVVEGATAEVVGGQLLALGQPETLLFLDYVQQVDRYTPMNADQSLYQVLPGGVLAVMGTTNLLPITSLQQVQQAVAS